MDIPKIHYIKLGFGGSWTNKCLEEGTIWLGYESPFHQESLQKNWDVVYDYWLDARNDSRSTASNDLRQIKTFYEASEEDIWITFHNRDLYWCKAAKEVVELSGSDDIKGIRQRKTLNGWSKQSTNGLPLNIDSLDGRVSTVQNYRGTICGVALPEYLFRKINGQTIPEAEKALENYTTLKKSLGPLIKGLNWQDFEILVDLIFSRSGWHRTSVLGKTQKNIDLEISQTTLNKLAFVQVKSSTKPAEIEKYINSFEEHEKYTDMFFICHHLDQVKTTDLDIADNIHLWGVEEICDQITRTGLCEWLITKRS